ncbi:MAG TPA: CopD family protein, partial [Candidatus Acidoferrales bacterium]|nr:CopD family protein [Candidatus Acidoferrales bacterium]
MQQLVSVFPYLSVIIRGLLLCLQSVLVGGVAFLTLILPPPNSDTLAEREYVALRIRCVLFWCSIGLAVIQIFYALGNSGLLMSTVNLRFSEVVGAQFFVVSDFIVIASAVFAWLIRFKKSMSCAVGMVLVILFGSVATGHAWSRLDHRAVLGVLDLLHQAAGGVWIGGLPILFIALRTANNSDLAISISQRFSRMALVGVGVVLVAGIGLSLFYFDAPSAIYGTSYGVMLLGKIGLFGVLVGIGALNKSIVARFSSGIPVLLQHLRRNLEAEIGIGFTVLLAAASLTSQPPAIDQPEDRASLHEAVHQVAPRWPQVSSPRA